MAQPASDHSHVHHHHSHASRRDFLRVWMGGALAGASILELAWHRAAWARAAAPGSDPELFDIQKVANGVYFARARPQAMINCNAGIFVRSKDVVVVDAHSKPSAAASLIAQIKREVTTKPVRYVINTHFHWDHTQGNHAYRLTGEKVDFIASAATRQLMADLGGRQDEGFRGRGAEADRRPSRSGRALHLGRRKVLLRGPDTTIGGLSGGAEKLRPGIADDYL